MLIILLNYAKPIKGNALYTQLYITEIAMQIKSNWIRFNIGKFEFGIVLHHFDNTCNEQIKQIKEMYEDATIACVNSCMRFYL